MAYQKKTTCFWRISNGSDLLLNVDERQKYSRAVSDISAVAVVSCYQCLHEGGQVSPAGKLFVLHLMFSCRISHRALYDSCSAFGSMRVVSSSQGPMFFWVSYRPQKD